MLGRKARVDSRMIGAACTPTQRRPTTTEVIWLHGAEETGVWSIHPATPGVLSTEIRGLNWHLLCRASHWSFNKLVTDGYLRWLC